MKKHWIAVVAVAFAGTVGAQTPAPATSAVTPQDAKVDANKAKQAQVKAATAGTAKGYTGAAADASTAAAKEKGTPRTAPDAAAKRESVKSATAGAGKGYGASAADASAKAAADKSERVKLQPQAGTPEMRKVVP